MANISDYGGIQPSITTVEAYQQTIETISGLLLLYSIIEEEYIRDGIIYHFFKKGFWGKKQLGYLKLEYLPGKHTDTSLSVDDSGNPLPPYTDIVIGIEYGSEYNSVNWSGQARIFNLVSPNKQVLSYEFLINNITIQRDAVGQLELEEMRSAGNMLMMDMGRMGYFRENIKLLDRVKSTLNVFGKFLSKSDYQPVTNE
ncbi:hypothetical protein ACFQZI_13190 [Mucilaginibacter lutimaris]|uniref:Uncharacterized protein n=1 Tax=Mucilaginibacter lutimaris TaxID=931629 RepID=A0ABW2ZI65_9SPHI